MSCALLNVNRSRNCEPNLTLLLCGPFAGRDIASPKLAKLCARRARGMVVWIQSLCQTTPLHLPHLVIPRGSSEQQETQFDQFSETRPVAT